MPALFALLTLLQGPPAVLDNDYVTVTKNASPCAAPADRCRDRIIVALGPVEVVGVGQRKLGRGDVAVFRRDERYAATGSFLEVVIKPDHPPATAPGVLIPPDKNAMLHDGREFFVFEERLEPGDTRARHSHSQRVVIVLNATRLQQWPDGQPAIFRDQIPDDVRFNPPVIHVVKTVGERPLRNIVIEFKNPSTHR